MQEREQKQECKGKEEKTRFTFLSGLFDDPPTGALEELGSDTRRIRLKILRSYNERLHTFVTTITKFPEHSEFYRGGIMVSLGDTEAGIEDIAVDYLFPSGEYDRTPVKFSSLEPETNTGGCINLVIESVAAGRAEYILVGSESPTAL